MCDDSVVDSFLVFQFDFHQRNFHEQEDLKWKRNRFGVVHFEKRKVNLHPKLRIHHHTFHLRDSVEMCPVTFQIEVFDSSFSLSVVQKGITDSELEPVQLQRNNYEAGTRVDRDDGDRDDEKELEKNWNNQKS